MRNTKTSYVIHSNKETEEAVTDFNDSLKPALKGTRKLPKKAKKFDAKNVSYKSRVKLINRVLINMRAQLTGVSNAGILLAGDPGVGKTSFVRYLAKLLGMNVVILEVPHLAEEHIINIPYIRYNPITNKTKREVATAKRNEFEVVIAESNLLSVLKNNKRIPDSKYVKGIYTAPDMANVRRLFEEMGGDKKSIPFKIHQVREQYSTILFIDEYFRETSTSIRNMLRGLLNKDLGLGKLPKYVYPIYASNINDDGVGSIPSNNQFSLIDINVPDKESWFGWLEDETEKYGIELLPEVFDKFHEVIEPEWLSFKDDEADVSTSPRRWEQLIYYVNSSLPLAGKTQEAKIRFAKALLTNVKENFTNYKTLAVSSIANPILRAVSDLIKETSSVEVSPNDTNPTYEWRDTLRHQIYRKMDLGDARKYVPVISGPPGVGKTSIVSQVAASLKLGLIKIDCSTLSFEQVQGNPIPSTNEDGEETTEFSDSLLYKIIQKRAEEEKPEKPFKGYNYIIFFDELNRTTTKTFNGLRKLILEKEFENGKKLPEGSIVLAAINPSDKAGITELTKHMVDVLDIITSTPSWKATLEWLREQQNNLDLENDGVSEGVLKVIEAFAGRFSVTKDTDVAKEFKLLLGEEEGVYISPREYAQIFVEASLSVDDEFEACAEEYGFDFIDPKADYVSAVDARLREAAFHPFEGIIKQIIEKEELDSPQFHSLMKEWFRTDPEASPIKDLIFFDADNSSLSSLLEHALVETDTPLAENIEIISRLKAALGSVEVVEFKQDLFRFFDDQIASSGIGYFTKPQFPFRSIKGGNIVEISDPSIVNPSDDYIPDDQKNGKVTLFTYICKELYIAIKLNGISNEFLEVLNQLVADYATNELIVKYFGSDDDFNMNQLSHECGELLNKD